MKKYKEIILDGLESRNFELLQIQNEVDYLPWWIEERWLIESCQKSARLYLTFLTEKHWESGTKFVDEIVLSNRPMEQYTDREGILLSISMNKGIFEEKLNAFWTQFEKLIQKLD